MNLDDLRAVQSDERGADRLQALPESFYRDAGAYLARLRQERERLAEGAEDPFHSKEVRRVTDEIETAEEVIEAIFERRIGKVVKRASLAASGVPTDDAGLTTEEAELFEDLVRVIETNRAAVLESLTDPRPVQGSEPPDSEPTNPEPGAADGSPEQNPDQAPDPGPDSDSDAVPSKPAENAPTVPPRKAEDPDEPSDHNPDASADSERVTVRVTKDIGEIFGIDERVYTLASEDVVSLPAANAKALLDRGAAERVR